MDPVIGLTEFATRSLTRNRRRGRANDSRAVVTKTDRLSIITSALMTKRENVSAIMRSLITREKPRETAAYRR